MRVAAAAAAAAAVTAGAAAATVADAEEDGLCNTSASSTLEIYAIGVFFLGASVRIGNSIGIRIVSIAFDSRTHSQ